MRLYYEIVENAEKTLNAKHLVNLIQKEKLTYSVRKIIIKRLKMSYHNNQKLTVSETAFNLIIDKNARHRFF